MSRRDSYRGSAALVYASAALCLVVSFIAACAGTRARRPPPPPLNDTALAAPQPAADTHGGTDALHRAFAQTPGDAGQPDVWLLDRNAEAWATRWKLISEAKESIDAAYFIVAPDPIGLAFLGLLRRKAAEGVKVRLLLDGRGSVELATPLTGLDYLHELLEVGDVEVRLFNPMAARLPDALVNMSAIPVSASTHQKLLIIDRKVAITGGRNISLNYYADNRDRAGTFTDAEIMVRGARAMVQLGSVFASEMQGEGAVKVVPDLVDARPRHDVLALHAAAMDVWLEGKALHPDAARALREDEGAVRDAALALEAAAMDRLGRVPPRGVREEFRSRSSDLARLPLLRGAQPITGLPDARGEARVIYKPSRLGKRENTITPALSALIDNAAREVVIETPYLVLTVPMLREFELAAQRGVRITVLTNGPRTSDNDVGSALFTEEWPEVLARVPTMRLFIVDGESPLHAKRAVYDEEMVVIGTYNLDPLSEAVNSEMAVLMHAPFFAQKNLRVMTGARSSVDIREYRIARDDDGMPVRDDAGKVVQLYGPANHCSQERLQELHELKLTMLGLEGFFDFEPAVW